MKENNFPKTYQVTALITIIYAVLLIFYSVYNQFLYVDGTWFHGFLSNGFSVLSGLIWIVIIFMFKKFLNRTLNYIKVNMLINAYLIFLSITTFSVAIIVYKSINIYTSLEEGDSFNSLTAFASSSILSVILLFISNLAIILISILLGNHIRKIDFVQNKLFQILGFSFIGYGIISLLGTVGFLGTDIFNFLIKALLSILIGMIIKRTFSMSFSDLNALTNHKNKTTTVTAKPKIEQKKDVKKVENISPTKNLAAKEVSSQNEELPIINLKELEDSDLILSYFDNLPKDEFNRLESIVENKYNRNLTKEQKDNLIIHYIVEKKMYDHQRFLPK